jgi:hypothetical protein
MIEGLALVAVLGAVAAAGLLLSFFRGARPVLAPVMAPRVGLDQVRGGPLWVAGRVHGEGHVEALAGGPAICTITTVTVTTRRASAGKVTIETYEVPVEHQPGVRVVPLSLRDDAGRSLQLIDLEKIEVLDETTDLFEDEVPVAELGARYPWLNVSLDVYATHVTVSQRALREGARVVVHGVLRAGGDVEAGSYRAPAVLALGAGGDDALVLSGASRARPVARVFLVGAVVAAVAAGLLVSSWLAGETAWMLRTLAR